MKDLSILEKITIGIAGLATLVNLVLSLSVWTAISVSALSDSTIVTRTVLVLFLETALGYAFGFLFKLALDLRDGPVVHSVVGALFIATGFAWISFFDLVFILFGGTVNTDLQFSLLGVLAGVTFLWGAYVGGLHADNIRRRELMIYIGSAQIPPFLLLYIAYFIQLK